LEEPSIGSRGRSLIRLWGYCLRERSLSNSKRGCTAGEGVGEADDP